MNQIKYALTLAAVLVVLAFAHRGWLVKAGVAGCSLFFFALYAYRNKLWGISVYLLVVLTLHVVADVLTFNNFSPDALWSYLILCLTMTSFVLVLGAAGMRIIPVVAINLFLLLLPLLHLTYYAVFSIGATRDVYYSILQTNLAEAIEFVRVNDMAAYLSASVLALIGVTCWLCHYLRNTNMVIKHHLQVLLLLALVAATAWRGQPRVNKDMLAYTLKYYNRLRLFHRRTAKRDISKINYHATKTGKGETYVIVIGESLNKHHMQIYGYPRHTTPMLAAEQDLLIFKQAYSSHILTGIVLARAFTASTQYNGSEWYEAVSIVDILQASQVKTSWLSNQDLYGSWLSFGVLLGKQTDYHLYLGNVFYESPHVDGVLLPHAARILRQQTQDNRVIFVHLMGNHSDYCARYPPAYARYQKKLAVAIYGGLAQTQVSHQQEINCYDNSVLYNDFIVSELLAELKKHQKVAGLVYFSDHATDVLRGKKRVTGGFNYEMTNIPLLMWFSPAYRKMYPQVYQNLRHNRAKLFSNDLLYDTLLGIMAITSNQYNPRADLSASTYMLTADEALVLNGEHRYNSKDNTLWRQQRHIAALVAQGQGNRAIPAAVNSGGKLKEVWRDGSRALAMDITARDTCLTVGRSDMCLPDFLAYVETRQITKLWLKINNLQVDNLDKELQKINRHLPATKIVVDVGTCHDAAITQAPYGGQLLCSLSPSQLADLTATTVAPLAAQLNKQKVQAIAFDAKFYPQIKKHLEPLLPAATAFHLRRVAGIEEIKNSAYWSDPRVQTIAFRYHSRFQKPLLKIAHED